MAQKDLLRDHCGSLQFFLSAKITAGRCPAASEYAGRVASLDEPMFLGPAQSDLIRRSGAARLAYGTPLDPGPHWGCAATGSAPAGPRRGAAAAGGLARHRHTRRKRYRPSRKAPPVQTTEPPSTAPALSRRPVRARLGAAPPARHTPLRAPSGPRSRATMSRSHRPEHGAVWPRPQECAEQVPPASPAAGSRADRARPPARFQAPAALP